MDAQIYSLVLISPLSEPKKIRGLRATGKAVIILLSGSVGIAGRKVPASGNGRWIVFINGYFIKSC